MWLQEHLYTGRTGALEVFCALVYVGHFFIPLALAATLALRNRAREFKLLMFGILTALMAGAITFIVAPTAPPWLASQDGYLPGVQHVLKLTLADMHLTSLAAMEGDATKYDVTAAVPSLHAAFPLICLLVARHARLPRAVLAFLLFDVVAVLFSIVYLGEHYVFDALVGYVYAFASVAIVRVALGSDAQLREAAPGLPARAR